MTGTKTPRHDLDAERAVIGAAMMDQRVLDDITLEAEDFFTAQHEQLWDHDRHGGPGWSPGNAHSRWLRSS
jgi:hypothetical protein